MKPDEYEKLYINSILEEIKTEKQRMTWWQKTKKKLKEFVEVLAIALGMGPL